MQKQKIPLSPFVKLFRSRRPFPDVRSRVKKRMNQQLWSSMGVEMTWLNHDKETEEEMVPVYIGMLRSALKKAKIPFYAIYNDSYALEFCTPSFEKVADLRRWYNKVIPYLECFPLVRSRADAVSGGGHIHVALPARITSDIPLSVLFVINSFRDITNRPYINWIFNDPANHQSAECFIKWKSQCRNANLDAPSQEVLDRRTTYLGDDSKEYGWWDEDILRYIFMEDPTINLMANEKQIWESLGRSTKGYALNISSPSNRSDSVSPKPRTMEYRCFDAKEDFEEMELHIQFLHHYLTWLEKISREGTLIKTQVKTQADVQSLAMPAIEGYDDRCVYQFQDLITMIGLNYGDYEYLVESNYRERKQRGLCK